MNLWSGWSRYFEGVQSVGKRLKLEDMKAVSYVHVGDKLVNTEDLDPEQRKRLATELAIGWLNGLFKGEAVFFRSGENPTKN